MQYQWDAEYKTMPGGRPKGSLNSNKQHLLRLLQETYPGYHPVIEMAKIAHDETADQALRASMHKEVAQYVTPKLKAMEVTLEADVKHQYFITGQPMQDKGGKVIELNPDSWALQHKPKHT